MAVNPESTARKIFSLPKEEADAIDNFRFDRRYKTESQAIRHLVRLGLWHDALLSIASSLCEALQCADDRGVLTGDEARLAEIARMVLDNDEADAKGRIAPYPGLHGMTDEDVRMLLEFGESRK